MKPAAPASLCSRPTSSRPSARPARRRLSSPRPVPPYLRVVELSACSNAPKIFCCFSAGMPMPVSETQSAASIDEASRFDELHVEHHLALLGELDRVADQVHHDLPQPAGIADSTCRARRPGCGRPVPGPFWWARRRQRLHRVAERCRADRTSTVSSSSLPASILEKSRMSLMSVSSESAESLTMSRYSRCSRVKSGVEHQFGHADDAVHRRANFVAHVGQKFALGLCRLFGDAAWPFPVHARTPGVPLPHLRAP